MLAPLILPSPLASGTGRTETSLHKEVVCALTGETARGKTMLEPLGVVGRTS